jgi:vacuolar protein sorting-associated protein 52
MWLDRLSGHSTPSGTPPPLSKRSLSPAPRRTSRFSPAPQPGRHPLLPRSSSLTLNSNESTTSSIGTSRASNSVGSKAGSSRQRPPGVTDPLEVLNGIIGIAKMKDRSANPVNTAGTTIEKPAQLIEAINFEGLSLEEFVLKDKESSQARKVEIGAQAAHQCGSCQVLRVFL